MEFPFNDGTFRDWEPVMEEGTFGVESWTRQVLRSTFRPERCALILMQAVGRRGTSFGPGSASQQWVRLNR